MTSDTRRPEAARRALLDAASALLADEGPEALTVRDIAARAGCSTMLVYSRFGGKPGVVEALYIEGFARLGAAIRAVHTTTDPLADLRRCGRAYRKFALENPTYYAIMFDRAVPDFEPSLDAMVLASGTLDVLARRVQRALDTGAFPSGDSREIAACLWSANHGVVSLELKHVGPPDIHWSTRHTQLVEAVIRGLATPK